MEQPDNKINADVSQESPYILISADGVSDKKKWRKLVLRSF